MEFRKQFKLQQVMVIPSEHLIQLLDNEEVQDSSNLQPKFIELLCYLAQQSPRVVPRQELIDQVWDGNNYVGEKALTNAIWHLRKIFTKYQQPDTIETIRKVGYKLTIEPTWLEPDELSSSTLSSEQGENSNKPAPFYKQQFALLLSALALMFVIFLLWPKLETFDDFKVTAITNEPGAELFPSPSPDGEKLVYAWSDALGKTNLFLRDLAQPNLPSQQITHDGLAQGLSTWSIDGKHLYFARKNRDTRQCHIIQLEVAALKESVLTQCPIVGGYYYLDTSYDGRYLAFHGRQDGDNESGIFLLDLKQANSKPNRLSCSENCTYRDRDFAFSPDGQWIAVTRRLSRFNENIHLINLTSGEEKIVTRDEEDIVGLSWHPSGEHLVYATQRSDVRRGFIYQLASDSNVAINIDGFSYPAFSKASGELFFQQKQEHYSIMKLQMNAFVASSPYPVVQSSFSHHYPHYSEAAKRLVYVSNVSGFYEIWTANANGSDRKQLTQLNASIRYTRWSNDGSKISFIAPTEDGRSDQLHIFDLAKNRIEIVETGFNSHNRPTWSPDDKSLISAVSHEGNTELYQFDIATGQNRKLTDNGGRYGVLQDNGQLIYSTLSRGVWQTAKIAEQPAVNIVPNGSMSSAYSWLSTDNGIYYFTDKEEYSQLSLQSMDGQETKALFQLPGKAIGPSANLTVADGQVIMFPQSALPQSDIMRLNHPLLD